MDVMGRLVTAATAMRDALETTRGMQSEDEVSSPRCFAEIVTHTEMDA